MWACVYVCVHTCVAYVSGVCGVCEQMHMAVPASQLETIITTCHAQDDNTHLVTLHKSPMSSVHQTASQHQPTYNDGRSHQQAGS